MSHLVSLAFVFREEDDGVGQRGGGRLHLLHHYLSGAVDGEDVAGEVLAGPSCCSACGTRDWKKTVVRFRISDKNNSCLSAKSRPTASVNVK